VRAVVLAVKVVIAGEAVATVAVATGPSARSASS
jgi:hypothetical protein